jgi:lipoprotein NlpI
LLLAAAVGAWAQGYTYVQKCADTFLGLELALDYCSRAIKSGDLSDDMAATAHYNRGAILSRRRGGIDKALADFDEAIRLHPRPAAYVARGTLKNAKRNYDGALADFSEALRMDAELAEAYLLRGLAWMRVGDSGKAVEDATQALKLQPVGPIVQAGSLNLYSARPRPMDRTAHDATAYKLRGMGRFLRAEFPEAASDLAETVRVSRDTESVLWLFMARGRAGANAEARTELGDYAKRMPEGSWARLISGLLLDEMTPQQLSATVVEKGIMRQVQRCQTSFYSGHWRLLRGEPPAARALFERAKERCPAGSNEFVGAEAELQRLGPKPPA